jgi:ketosteroid isomerase-like protein
MPMQMPELITRYFEYDAVRDVEAIVALFTDDASVTDEGEARQGVAAIRDWQLGPASRYTYHTELHGTEQVAPDRYLVTGRLTGDFPGGTADLRWDFTIAGSKIGRLAIAP